MDDDDWDNPLKEGMAVGGKVQKPPVPRMPHNPLEANTVSAYSLQLSLPPSINIWAVHEERSEGRFETKWFIHGLANSRAFTIELTRLPGEPFPFDEALQKLRVFA
jgi:hypothetical protein